MPAEGARSTAALVRAGAASAREVAAEHLAAARRHANLGALWEVDEAAVLSDAERVDRLRASGADPGSLAGVPVVVKDSFAVRGLSGDGGSGRPAVASRDAAAVARLRRAGSVVLGKAAMHQLAWGTSGQTPGRPTVHNPSWPDRQPGGSSSGCAVAVAAGIAPLAVGSDSAGSIRIPAAWCGVVGWKPRQRAIPRAGLLPLAPTLDAVGCLAGSVDDAELVADALTSEATTRDRPDIVGLRVLVDAAAFSAADAAVVRACSAVLSGLAGAGAHVREGDSGLPVPRVGALYAVELADAWADAVQLADASVGADVRAGIQAGLGVPAVDYLRARRAVQAARTSARLDADAVVMPAVPIGPPALEAPDDVRTSTRFTRPFNVVDWPALVIPCPGEVPAALQFAGPRGSEPALWALARAAERAAGEQPPARMEVTA